MAAVVPLVPDKAREGAWGWLLRRRCTVAAVVPLVSDEARERAWGWLLPRRCIVAAVVASHERFRTIAMTTTVLRRRTRVFESLSRTVTCAGELSAFICVIPRGKDLMPPCIDYRIWYCTR